MVRKIIYLMKPRAEAIIDDPQKMNKFLDTVRKNFMSKFKKYPHIAGSGVDFLWLLSMLGAYAKKEYTDVSRKTLIISVGGLFFIIMPYEFYPEGPKMLEYLMNIKILKVILDESKVDIDKYRAWKESQEGDEK